MSRRSNDGSEVPEGPAAAQPARTRAAPCPVCGKPSRPEHRSFCSARCADVDLGRWLSGTYRVETEEHDDRGTAEG